MYILKIKGKAKIPDYVQLRANDFTLKAYVRLDRPEKGFEKCGLTDRIPELMQLLSELDFGVVHKID